MQINKQSYSGRIILAFIITNLVFILIFLFSFSVSYLNYQKISTQNNIIHGYIIQSEEALNKLKCDFSLLIEASENLDEVGNRLFILETRFGKNDRRVLEQKSFYSELEIKHFEIIKELNKKCDERFLTILFFYSNNKPFDKESEKIGFILSAFKNRNPEKVMIYSFDANQDTELTKTLKSKYKINETPIIIINEQVSLKPKNIDDLDAYL